MISELTDLLHRQFGHTRESKAHLQPTFPPEFRRAYGKRLERNFLYVIDPDDLLDSIEDA
jgi:hypothetical protein